jgi:hypothetical protein
MVELLAYNDDNFTFIYKKDGGVYHWSSWCGNYKLNNDNLYDLLVGVDHKHIGMPFESFEEIKWHVMEKFISNMINKHKPNFVLGDI